MSGASGKRILIVEDEYLLARQLARALTAEGAQIVASVGTVAGALDRLQEIDGIDLAILDINLGGERVYPVAFELQRRGIGFIFVSGYDLDERNDRFADVPQLTKPLTLPALMRAVRDILPPRPAPSQQIFVAAGST